MVSFMIGPSGNLRWSFDSSWWISSSLLYKFFKSSGLLIYLISPSILDLIPCGIEEKEIFSTITGLLGFTYSSLSFSYWICSKTTLFYRLYYSDRTSRYLSIFSYLKRLSLWVSLMFIELGPNKYSFNLVNKVRLWSLCYSIKDVTSVVNAFRLSTFSMTCTVINYWTLLMSSQSSKFLKIL